MIQISNLTFIAAAIYFAEKSLGVRMRSTSVAFRVAGISIIELLLAYISNYALPVMISASLLILLINPILEEFVRVRYSMQSSELGSLSFLSTSLMIGSLESIVKTFSLTNQFQTAGFFDKVNIYIVISGLISIFLHLNFGFILRKLRLFDRPIAFVLMVIIHSSYNFTVVSIEPKDIYNKNIFLGLFLSILMAVVIINRNNEITKVKSK